FPFPLATQKAAVPRSPVPGSSTRLKRRSKWKIIGASTAAFQAHRNSGHNISFVRVASSILSHHMNGDLAIATEDIDADVLTMPPKQKVNRCLADLQVLDVQLIEERRHERIIEANL